MVNVRCMVIEGSYSTTISSLESDLDHLTSLVKIRFDAFLGGAGMGMHSWKGSCMEYPIYAYNIWNAVFGSKLDGLSTERKLCRWMAHVDEKFCHIGPRCWV